ncbi:MAG: hypothetical protein ACR2OZ_13345 [Verrucomicrobiales bacterium]
MNVSKLMVADRLFSIALALSPCIASSQTGTNIGRRDTGVSPGLKPSTGAKIESTTIVKLGTARNWRSADGKQIVAELVSWPVTDPQAAEKHPRDLKFDVVRDNQVRLRKDKQTFTLPLGRLSPEDRLYLQQVVDSLAKAQGASASEAKR